MEGNDETANDIENQYNDALEDSIMEDLRALSALSSSRCIYRIPERLRQANEKAYTPQVVSIGPFHHGKAHLEAMEEQKMRYLKYFMDRTKVSLNGYIKKIREKEAKLRNCYAEHIAFSSDEFVRIILVDAAFIIELLLRYRSPEFREEDDCIFHKQNMKRDIRLDLRLLENQLPFFILKDLFDPDTLKVPSLITLSSNFFKTKRFSGGTEGSLERIDSQVEVKHFVDFLRILCLESRKRGRLKTVNIPSITKLHQAGVKFKVRPNNNNKLIDIHFADGTLEIPKLKIDGTTEVTIRNLVAFEQCHYEEKYMTDYVTVMDSFVNTPRDVELLVENGIIENCLADNSEVSTLINNLGRGFSIGYNNFYYAGVCEDLKTHCGTPWHKWKANLRQNYLNTPWAITSVIAAVFLLILTLIQAVCSIISTV